MLKHYREPQNFKVRFSPSRHSRDSQAGHNVTFSSSSISLRDILFSILSIHFSQRHPLQHPLHHQFLLETSSSSSISLRYPLHPLHQPFFSETSSALMLFYGHASFSKQPPLHQIVFTLNLKRLTGHSIRLNRGHRFMFQIVSCISLPY